SNKLESRDLDKVKIGVKQVLRSNDESLVNDMYRVYLFNDNSAPIDRELEYGIKKRSENGKDDRFVEEIKNTIKRQKSINNFVLFVEFLSLLLLVMYLVYCIVAIYRDKNNNNFFYYSSITGSIVAIMGVTRGITKKVQSMTILHVALSQIDQEWQCLDAEKDADKRDEKKNDIMEKVIGLFQLVKK
ncbi:MAG: hypothetical protein MJA29_14360, partial [Candidatus Omnitrophica bacterium]|nr:hypothetical protein [Candidatus Omnitrophota bacterium]